MMSVSPWSPAVTMLLAAWLALYLVSFGLFHLMIFRVNAWLSDGENIPHSLYWGKWSQLRDSYRIHYPGSSLYSVVVMLTVIGLLFAACAAGLLWWQFAVGA
jgi:hypothetical protein